MDGAREQNLADARRYLRGPEQRADRDRGFRIDTGAAEDREQVRGEAGWHEHIGRERRRDEREWPSPRRKHDLGASYALTGRTQVRTLARHCERDNGAATNASSAA